MTKRVDGAGRGSAPRGVLAGSEGRAATSTSSGVIPLRAERWMLDAACRGLDPDMFFPLKAGGPGVAPYKEAKRVCDACPVRADCLAWAMDAEGFASKGYRFGMLGGLTPMERVRRAGGRR